MERTQVRYRKKTLINALADIFFYCRRVSRHIKSIVRCIQLKIMKWNRFSDNLVCGKVVIMLINSRKNILSKISQILLQKKSFQDSPPFLEFLIFCVYSRAVAKIKKIMKMLNFTESEIFAHIHFLTFIMCSFLYITPHFSVFLI